MSQPFLGEIKIFSFNFAPRGWSLCNGQLLPIAQNQALFALLGTTYGGNGTINFALPNFQSRVPIHFGQGPGLPSYVLGQVAGVENVTLLSTQMPQHNHPVACNNAVATAGSPANNFWAQLPAGAANRFGPAGNAVAMNAADIGNAGGNQPHPNMPPFLVLNFCIALQGVFPSRN